MKVKTENGEIIYKSCLYCKEPFKPNHAAQLYCNEEHRIADKLKREDYERKLKKRIKRELEEAKWNKSTMAKINRWYDMMGMDNAVCGGCGATVEENLIKHKVPLHMEVTDSSLRDYRLLDHDSWFVYCTDCYMKIKFMSTKDNTQSN